MINASHRILAGAVLSPLLWGLACSPRPDPEIKSAESALFVPGSLQLTLTSVQGSDGPSLPFTVSMAFANLTPPPGSPTYPTQTNLGTCSLSRGCADLRPPTAPWTKSFSTLGQTLPFAGTFKAQSQDLSGTLFGCFNFGLNTTTNTLVSLPYNPGNCSGGISGNNTFSTLTCTGSNCAAKLFLHGPGGRPMIVNFTYKVIPPVTNGTAFVTPNYTIMNVYYAPPGTSSSMSYQQTTSVGTTTSITSSFQQGMKVTSEAGTSNKITDVSGGVSITQNSTWGTSQTDETDLEVDVANGYKVNGQVDGVDHNFDEVWLLLSPKLLMTYSQPLDPNKPASVNWSFVANQDGINNAVPIKLYVGWLNGLIPISDPRVMEALNAHGVTTNDFPNILNADPLATGSPNPLVYPNRYVHVGTYMFEPVLGTNPNTQTVILTQKSMNSSMSTDSFSYSLGFTITGGSDNGLLQTKFVQENTLTWTDSSSVKLSKGTTTTDTLTIAEPAASYQGPIFGNVYEDTIFKTYAFSLDSMCGGSGAAAQVCNNPGSNPQCVATVWGFESGEPPAWNNSDVTMSTVSTLQAHGGTQSMRVSASSDPMLPASVNVEQCFSAAGGGTMNLAGRTYSAWVLVPTSTSSYAGTSCRLRAFDQNFQAITLPSGAARAPVPPGAWFQLSGVFPSTATSVYELTVDCSLPTDWTFGDVTLPATKAWYVDDIMVN